MKKLFLVLTLLIFSATAIHSQSIQLGIKGGLNFANFSGATIQTETVTSYNAGFIAEFKIIDKFAFQPELLYTTQGASYKNATEEFINELGYIAIPVLAKIYLSKSISLELGPQASFLLSEKNKFNVKDSNTFEFSAAAGLNLKITDSLFIQGRYVLGLTEVSSKAEYTNAVIQLSAGILF